MHSSYIAAGVGPSLVVIGRRSPAVRIAITSRLNPAHLPLGAINDKKLTRKVPARLGKPNAYCACPDERLGSKLG
jgi:hypothetical protein